jgi:NADPH:quinone reductase
MPQAIVMHNYGTPDVLALQEIQLQPLQPTEIRFRVLAAPVNRADLEIRSGNWQIMQANPFPYTPGLEATGEVIEVGTAVQDIAPGQNVITMMQKLGGIWGIRPGGYQEFVTVEAEKVATIPAGVDPLTIAALGLAAVTALEGLNRLALEPGNHVLIQGATGGVGSIAVQLARLLGAEVLAATGSPSKTDFLRELGVNQVVYFDQNERLVGVEPRSLDAVLETIGQKTFRDSVSVLKRGGRLCLVGAASGEDLSLVAWDLLQDLHLTGYSSENLTGDALRQNIAQLCSWVADLKLPPPVYQQFPLVQASHVHNLMENRQLTGRALLIP